MCMLAREGGLVVCMVNRGWDWSSVCICGGCRMVCVVEWWRYRMGGRMVKMPYLSVG